MVDNLGRRTMRCLLAAAAVALAGAPAALANDADLDPTFGQGGQALFDDPLFFGGKGDERPLNRNIPVDAFEDADGRLVVLGTNLAFRFRGDPLANQAFRLSRLTPSGAPDPAFAAGGVPGESAPLRDGDAWIVARDAHPGPGGSIYVLGTPTMLNFVGDLTLTRVGNDGSLDSTFNDGTATRMLFAEDCARVAVAGFRPDGKIAMLIDRGLCEIRGNGVHDELRVVSVDGTIDEAASAPVDDGVGTFALSQLAFGIESGQIVTYLSRGALEDPGEHRETPILKFGPSGERDMSFGTEGVATVRGQVVEFLATAAGAPQALGLDFTTNPGVRGGVTVQDDLENVVTRLTTGGQPDATFGTGGETVLPGLRPDLGEGHYAYDVGMTIDPKGRTHLIGAGFEASSGQTPHRVLRGYVHIGDFSSVTLMVSRLTTAGLPDPAFGTGGERVYPAPDGQVRFGIERFFTLLFGFGSPDFHQADGKLVVPHLLWPIDSVERGFAPDTNAAALRLSGTTVDPVVTPPTPPAPAAPAAAQGVSAKKPRTCRSRRAFTIRLRPKGSRLRSAVVTVNGKRVQVKKGKRYTAPVNLKGRIPATIRVRIVAKDIRGRTHRETRTYRTCRYAGRPLKNVTVG